MMMQSAKLTEKEKSRIVTAKSLDHVPNPRGLGYEIYYSMLENWSNTAQIDAETEESDTYGCLLRKCIRMCINLLLMGITKDDIICQYCENHFNSCVPVICAIFLGTQAVSLDPSLPRTETTQLLNQVRPRIIFVSPSSVELIKEALDEVDIACEIVVFGPHDEYEDFQNFLEPVDGEYSFKPFRIDSLKDTAIILFNCEKTGSVQGVRLSHYNLMVSLRNIISYWNLGDYKRIEKNGGFMTVLDFGCYYWLSGILILLGGIMAGIVRIVNPDFETSTVWKNIDKYSVSFMKCTTYQAMQLYKNPKPEGAKGKSLKMLVTSGTAMSKPILLELRKLFPFCFITNTYERPEMAGCFSMFSFKNPGDIRDQYENPLSSGKIAPGTECKIVDPLTEKILAVNQAGELRYKTDLPLEQRYYKSDQCLPVDDDGWVKTGDIAYYDERRCICVLDPYEDVFRYKCWHIVPSILEGVIKLHPAVKDAIVIGIPQDDEEIGEKPMGIVSLNKHMSQRVTEKDIENFANAILTKKQKLTAGLKIVKKIPLTPLGKPRRQEMRSKVLKGEFCEENCVCNLCSLYV